MLVGTFVLLTYYGLNEVHARLRSPDSSCSLVRSVFARLGPKSGKSRKIISVMVRNDVIAERHRISRTAGQTMPLITEGKSKPIPHPELRAIGFWMAVRGANPVQPVRVFVSYEVLADLDPFDIRDLTSAFEHFERFRSRIEAAASAKFDRIGSDADKYEGMPTIRLTTNDPI